MDKPHISTGPSGIECSYSYGWSKSYFSRRYNRLRSVSLTLYHAWSTSELQA